MFTPRIPAAEGFAVAAMPDRHGVSTGGEPFATEKPGCGCLASAQAL
jgi:hypothetical protein